MLLDKMQRVSHIVNQYHKVFQVVMLNSVLKFNIYIYLFMSHIFPFYHKVLPHKFDLPSHRQHSTHLTMCEMAAGLFRGLQR